MGIFIKEYTRQSAVYTGQPLSVINSHHLFYINVEQFLPRITDYQKILSTKELEKAMRFHRSQDQENFLVRKYALRVILSQFLHISGKDLEYSQIDNKKPAIANLHFNSTHSKNVVAIAVSAKDIGVDIEFLKDDFDFSELLPQCFNLKERSYIVNGPDSLLKFYTLWTRKEALLKASGEGLTDNLVDVACLDDILLRKKQNFEINSFQTETSIISVAHASDQNKLQLWQY